MDLGNTTPTGAAGDGRSTAQVLAAVREDTAVIDSREIDRLSNIVAWANRNVVASVEAGAATIRDSYIDTGLPIAGDGAPLVSEFALMELCATLGRSTASGREYVGKILELAWRLPSIWTTLLDGTLAVWRALRIADLTRMLSADAAAFVDRHLASVAGTCTWAQIDRLVAEAMVRFDPEEAEARRNAAAEHRRFDVHTDQAGADGTVAVEGTLDLADALDLDEAVGLRAKDLARLGCEQSLDVRRAMAVGEMARADLTLGLSGGGDGEQSAPAPTGRKIVLNVHLSQAAVKSTDPVARLGDTHGPVSAEQVRTWCGSAETTSIVVKPVVDLADHVSVDSYEIPDRIRERVLLRDHTCAFPHCNQRSERCDLDHATPHARGGVTCPCNLVPICRTHHRAKTHSAWRYVVLEPGSYLWTAPHGGQWLVDHHGTRDLSGCEARCARTSTTSPTDPPEH